jgi:hypothetical protein
VSGVGQPLLDRGSENKKTARGTDIVGFAGGSAGMAVSRYSPVALCHRLSTVLLWAASCS